MSLGLNSSQITELAYMSPLQQILALCTDLCPPKSIYVKALTLNVTVLPLRRKLRLNEFMSGALVQ